MTETAIVVTAGLLGIVFAVLLVYGVWTDFRRWWQWKAIQRAAVRKQKAWDRQWAREQRRWHGER